MAMDTETEMAEDGRIRRDTLFVLRNFRCIRCSMFFRIACTVSTSNPDGIFAMRGELGMKSDSASTIFSLFDEDGERGAEGPASRGD